MAKTFNTGNSIESRPKKTRQGQGKHSKYSATARNSARKRPRGQGKQGKNNIYKKSVINKTGNNCLHGNKTDIKSI